MQAGSIHQISFAGPLLPASLVVPRQLPLAVRDFVGRADRVAALDALLPTEHDGAGDTGAVVISALDGTGGVGKTTLAVHWAHRVQHRFPDGTLYMNLRGYGPNEPATPAEILDGFLRALGCPPEAIPAGLEAQTGLYRSLLAGRRVLIVLDNANAADQVRPLLPGSAGCLVLVTSRASLTGLVISEGAIRITLDLLAPHEAIDLVRGIVGWQRVESEQEAVVQLTQMCVRLPLALRIAAHRAAARPNAAIADLVAELSDMQTRLDYLAVPGDDLATVRTVLSWSDRALTAEQSRMLRLLGLHPGPQVSADAAAALADTSPAEARRLLDALAEVHLLEHTTDNRYVFHDLLRAYVSERVSQGETAEECDAAIDRLLGWYLHACNATRRLPPFSPRVDAPPPRYPLIVTSQAQAREWQQAELTNVIAMARLAADTNRDIFAWQLPAAGLDNNIVPFDDLIAAFEAGLSAALRLGDLPAQAWMLVVLGNFQAHQRRRFSESVKLHQQALAISREASDRKTEASAMNGIGIGLRGLARVAEAIDLHQQALAMWREDGDQWSSGIGLLNLAHDYQQLGQLDQAAQHYVQAEAIFATTGDQYRLPGTWAGRAHIAVQLGRYSDAVDLYNQALTLNREIRSHYYEMENLIGLGVAWHLSGDTYQAQQCWEDALTICQHFHYPHADEIRAHLHQLDTPRPHLAHDEPTTVRKDHPDEGPDRSRSSIMDM